MAGRKNKYFTQVQPHLSEIDEWLNNGATEKQCSENLNIPYSSWSNYKRDFEELRAICEKPRVNAIMQVYGALYKSAIGFNYTEKKVYTKTDNDGKEYKYTEVTEKYQPPNTTAAFGWLNMNDPQYVKDKKLYQQKQEELELKKKEAAANDWTVE